MVAAPKIDQEVRIVLMKIDDLVRLQPESHEEEAKEVKEPTTLKDFECNICEYKTEYVSNLHQRTFFTCFTFFTLHALHTLLRLRVPHTSFRDLQALRISAPL